MTSSRRPPAPAGDRTQAAIVECAARLLREQGASAVTTRAVAPAAGMQAPTIYRLFGTRTGCSTPSPSTSSPPTSRARPAQSPGPMATRSQISARAGTRTSASVWPTRRCSVFSPIPAAAPVHRRRPPAWRILHARVHRVAAAGRLRVTERRAVELIHAAGTGAVLTLLSVPPADRDPGLADRSTMRQAGDHCRTAAVPSGAAAALSRCVPAFPAVPRSAGQSVHC